MKFLFLIAAILFSSMAWSMTMNEMVLEAVGQMPKQGGYVLTSASPIKLRDSFSWNMDELLANEKVAIPSYCTTATYLVLFKVLKKYWDENGHPSKEVQELYKPNLENDGVRVWGRWNSNGPGTSKFFHDTKLGINFFDLSEAQAGDFLKIYWNDEVGKNEKAHSVVFLKAENGTLTFWSSNTDTNGYGKRTIPMSMAKKLLFSRLTNPENAANILEEPSTDEFLASMLTKISSWKEVKEVLEL